MLSAVSARNTPLPTFSSTSLGSSYQWFCRRRRITLGARPQRASTFPNRQRQHPNAPRATKPRLQQFAGWLRTFRHHPYPRPQDSRFRPWYVRCVSAKCRIHFARRPIVALHGTGAKLRIGAAICHDSAGGKNAVQARWKDDRFGCWCESYIVACCSYHHDAVVIGQIDGVGESARGQTAHAHGEPWAPFVRA